MVNNDSTSDLVLELWQHQQRESMHKPREINGNRWNKENLNCRSGIVKNRAEKDKRHRDYQKELVRIKTNKNPEELW